MAFLQKENSCSFPKIFYVGKTLYNGAYLRREKAVLSNVGNKGNDFQAPEGMMLTLMRIHEQDDSQFLRCFNRLHTSLKTNIAVRLQASPTRKPEQLANQFPNTSGIVNNHGKWCLSQTFRIVASS
jgi:hypothetical protein